MGRCQEAELLCRSLIARLRFGAEHGQYARCCFILSVIYDHLGDLERAIESANLSHFTFRRIEDYASAVRTLNWHGNIYFFKSDYQNALHCWKECESLSLKHNLERARLIARENAGQACILLGDVSSACDKFVGNRRDLASQDERLNVFRHDLSIAYLCILKHQFRRAERCLKAYTTEHRESFPLREQGIWYEYFGELELSRGRLDAAEQYLKTAITIGEQSGPDLSLIGQSRRLLAQVYLAAGDLSAARAECRRAYEAVRTVGERIEIGICDRIMGEIHERSGQSDDAHQYFDSSIRMLRMIGARVELGRTLLAAAQQTAIDRRQRLGHLLEAERLFSESGIVYWVDQVHQALHTVFEQQDRESPKRRASRPSSDTPTFITRNANTRETLQLAERWAQSELAILLTGETGTGKDLLAEIIHKTSRRRDQPFVDIDLSTLSDTIWESELFGHKKGSFTGALTDKVGLLESADGGTVFLNEIGNLPLTLQAKLLEFLDTHEIRRVGDTQRTKLNVRLIAATNSDLRDAVDEGQFRPDLYYRLNHAHLHLMPLRERTEDIPALIRHYLRDYGATEDGVNTLNGQPWMKRALSQRWIGNVRQLCAFIGRLASVADLHDPSTWAQWADFLLNYNERIERDDRRQEEEFKVRVIKVLDDHDWNQRASARVLEMSESSLRRQLRRWGVVRSDE
ncbi:MAG: AAA family ATPase [candidate division Zixibacteria bacterium]|nr:AAA family ATPase [candidate division Zixibacteria bacterium]